MIRKVHVKYFKRFRDQVFDLSDHLVLAGPNNSGKTTLLQSIVIWSLALQKWRERRGPDSQAKLRTGVPVTRQDFTALPLRLIEHIWTDTITGLTKDELRPEQKQGAPRVLEIAVEGEQSGEAWRLAFEFRYSSSEQLYVRALPHDIPSGAENLTVVHVPPFSGIGHAETRVDKPYQDLLIGQGKAGDILRNLLYEVYQDGAGEGSKWRLLCDQVANLFKVELLPPEYAGTPHIVCEYVRQDSEPKKGKGRIRLDVASAGSGFHQVLLLLGFFYARPATILLLDEPDAHLHVILQKQIYDTIRRVATSQHSQVLIATHSEVLINDTAPRQILSFYGPPHRLHIETERDQVREALKRLTAMDLLSVDKSPSVLYAEDQTDVDLLRAWAGVLQHPVAAWLDTPFINLMRGRKPREAKSHFFALRSISDSLQGLVLLDGDNRNEPDSEVAAPRLVLRRWRRYEAETYLCHPASLRRYIASVASPMMADVGDRYLQEQMPPVLYREPLQENDYWTALAASKTLLPELFRKCGLDLPKTEYYLIAEQMLSTEIPIEVVEVLDVLLRSVDEGHRRKEEK